MLRVYSIFKSISGEWGGIRQGFPATFIRLAECNLNCCYCDSERARSSKQGKEMSIEEIIKKVIAFDTVGVVITGGEPLLQKDSLGYLIKQLRLRNKYIQIETNGSIISPYWDTYVHSWVVDIKLPSSECGQNISFGILRGFARHPGTIFKAVCSSKEDFMIAKSHMEKIRHSTMLSHGKMPTFCISPVDSPDKSFSAKDLTDMLLESGEIDIGLSLQIHKYIWPDGEKGDRSP